MADVEMEMEWAASGLEALGWTRIAENRQTGEIALERREANPLGVAVYMLRLTKERAMVMLRVVNGDETTIGWVDVMAEPMRSALLAVGAADWVLPQSDGAGETRIRAVRLVPELQEMVDGAEAAAVAKVPLSQADRTTLDRWARADKEAAAADDNAAE